MGATAECPERVLVVGVGFLGRAVAEAFIAAEHPVTVLNRSPLSDDAMVRLQDARILIGDANDRSVVEDALDGADTIVFAAGLAVPTISADDERQAVLDSLRPLRTVLDGVARRPSAQFLYLASGGTVYGEPVVEPVPEHHPLRPASLYAAMNVAAECELEGFRTARGVRATSLRCANPYGPGQRLDRKQGVVGALLWSDDVVPMFGDGSAVRDYIYVRDLASAVVGLATQCHLPAAVNIGTGVGTSLLELVALVENVTGRSITIRHEPARPTDLHRVVLDVSRLRSLVSFAPLSLDQGIAATYAEDLAALRSV